MDKKVVKTDKAASGKVPLSQGILVDGWLFCSGQLPLDPNTGALVPGGIAEQTRRVIENLKAVCEAAGTSLQNAVKVTIYMADLDELQEMNQVFENTSVLRIRPHEPPSRPVDLSPEPNLRLNSSQRSEE